jgi:hypothetical protein
MKAWLVLVFGAWGTKYTIAATVRATEDPGRRREQGPCPLVTAVSTQCCSAVCAHSSRLPCSSFACWCSHLNPFLSPSCALSDTDHPLSHVLYTLSLYLYWTKQCACIPQKKEVCVLALCSCRENNSLCRYSSFWLGDWPQERINVVIRVCYTLPIDDSGMVKEE